MLLYTQTTEMVRSIALKSETLQEFNRPIATTDQVVLEAANQTLKLVLFHLKTDLQLPIQH